MLITTDAKGFLRHGAHTSRRLRRKKKSHPKTQSGVWDGAKKRFGRSLWKVLGGAYFFFGIYVNYWLVLVAWDLWNLQRHPTKPSQPMLLRIAPFFLGLTAAHSKKNNQVSVWSVFQHIFSWNIFLHHLVLHRFVSWKVNKDVWGAPLLEPFGLFKHEKKQSFMISQRSYCSQKKTSIPSLQWLVNKDPFKKLLSNSKMHKHFGVSNFQLPA